MKDVLVVAGGYTNATQFQVSTAYKCAVILRDLIAPYILQRRKSDVGTQLPEKKEQVISVLPIASDPTPMR